MISRELSAFALVTTALLAVACSSDAIPEETDDEIAAAAGLAPSLDVATGLGVPNARMPVPGLVTAGQPTVEQLEALSAAGYTNFISLRPESENGAGWEEAHSVDHDYDFDRIPISGAGSLTRENVEALAALLEEARNQPTVVYCASSNRVGAMLALKAFWLDGASPEDALELGRAGGMTRLEGAVTELLGLEPGD